MTRNKIKSKQDFSCKKELRILVLEGKMASLKQELVLCFKHLYISLVELQEIIPEKVQLSLQLIRSAVSLPLNDLFVIPAGTISDSILESKSHSIFFLCKNLIKLIENNLRKDELDIVLINDGNRQLQAKEIVALLLEIGDVFDFEGRIISSSGSSAEEVEKGQGIVCYLIKINVASVD